MIGPQNQFISLSKQQVIADYYKEHGELENLEAQRMSMETQRMSLQAEGVESDEAETKGFFFGHQDPTSPSLVEVFDVSEKPLKPQDKQTCKENIRKADCFYRKVFSLHPVNTDSKNITAYINHEKALNNASWNTRTKKLYFGACDRRLFQRDFFHYTDIIVHELGHATIQFYSKGLTYPYHQTGALQESISDVFAIIFNHYNSETLEANSPDAEWVLSKDLVVMPNGSFAPLRSFKSPGSAYSGTIAGDDEQVAHWNEYVEEPIDSDRGGVHKYAGIPSHAFYLAATRIGGPIWKDIGQIWFKAMKISEGNEDFKTFAGKTIAIAATEYGEQIANEVGQAWISVGILPKAQPLSYKQIAVLTGRMSTRALFSPGTFFKFRNINTPPYFSQVINLDPLSFYEAPFLFVIFGNTKN